MTENVFYDIRHYGASVQSDRPSTKAIQAAIDACHEGGGGIVQIPSGIFHSGTLYLKSNVTLELAPGAEIRAVENLEAFPETELSVQSNFHLFFRHALVFADKAENVGIRGQGIINCRGEAKAFEQAGWILPERYMNRPSTVRFVNCQNVRVRDVTIRDSAFWTFHLLACRDVVIHGITIHSYQNKNTDGIDIDSCENVRISGCLIESHDDSISIKATTALPCRRILIDNCVLASNCNAIRIGAENYGGFEDIRFSNLHIFNTGNAITLQNIDGYPMRRISFTNISMEGIRGTPIHAIVNRKPYPIGVPEEELLIPLADHPGVVEDVSFEGVSGTVLGRGEGKPAAYPITISGHSQAPVNGLTLRNIKLTYPGGGTNDEAATLIENLNDNPNPNGAFPVSGLMLRYVTHIEVDTIQFSFQEADARRTVVLENIQGGRVRDIAILSPSAPPVFTSFDTAGLRIKDLSWKDAMNDPAADWQEFKTSTGKQSICIGQ